MAEAFLQAATQAPQPMQAAAMNASSAFSLAIGRLLASCALPVLTDTKPPAEIMRSKDERSTTKSFMTGKATARHGSTTMVSPSLNERMCNWQVATPVSGPCGRPLMCMAQEPQMPSRQSWSKATGSLFSWINCSLRMSNISRKDISGEMPSRG